MKNKGIQNIEMFAVTKKDKYIHLIKIFQQFIFALMLLIIVFIIAMISVKNTEFIGNLENYDNYKFVLEDEEKNYKLIIVNDDKNKKIAYALHTSNLKNTFEFYDNDKNLVAKLDETDLIAKDFYVIKFNNVKHRQGLHMKIIDESNQVLVEKEFVYYLEYEETYETLFLGDENDKELLNLTEIIETKSVLDNIKEYIRELVFAIVIIGLMVITIAPLFFKLDEILLDIDKKALEKTREENPNAKIAQISKYGFLMRFIIRAICALPFTIATIVIFIIIGADAGETPPLEYQNFEVENASSKFNVTLNFASNYGYLEDEITYLVLYDKSQVKEDYIGSLQCGGKFIGSVKINDDKNKEEDVLHNRIILETPNACNDVDVATFVILEAGTQNKVYESEEFKIYSSFLELSKDESINYDYMTDKEMFVAVLLLPTVFIIINVIYSYTLVTLLFKIAKKIKGIYSK